jgi:tripeptide aminopeptidase
MKNVVNRFLSYVKQDTQSDYETGLTPSTPGQMKFARALADELKRIGLDEVSLDDNGYIMATLPANTRETIPVIGFIAHMDTSPDMSGKHVMPRIVSNYDGNDIVLNEAENIVLKTDIFPDILKYKGEDIVVTNGKTLLGADDKAGVAEIVTAMEYLIQHPEIVHGKIRIGFTPDEEIGAGANFFDVVKFGADWAYTMDGGEIGELEYENFNAAWAKITFHGLNVHPGHAKHKMRNSIRIANQFITLMPRFQTPEHTEHYEGFFHLTDMAGTVEKTELKYIIRDHSKMRFEERKKEVIHMVNKINAEFGAGTCELDMKDQYYNMREKIEPAMHIVDIAERAMLNCKITPIIKPIRGGTDGARLSYMGLPCPNIFGGGHNFHGRFEFIPVKSMEKAVEVIIEIINITTQKEYSKS